MSVKLIAALSATTLNHAYFATNLLYYLQNMLQFGFSGNLEKKHASAVLK